MAKLNIDVDTENKEVSVTVDGEKVENVMDIYVYTQESGYFSVEIDTRKDFHGMKEVTRLFANKNDKKFKKDKKYEEEANIKAMAELIRGE